MKNNIHYSKEALRDLDGIWDYIAEEFSDPDAAMRTVSRILNGIDKLVDFPEIGAPLSSITEVDSDYRFIVVGKYLAFYRVCAENVYIDRILYGRRDVLRILFGELSENEP